MIANTRATSVLAEHARLREKPHRSVGQTSHWQGVHVERNDGNDVDDVLDVKGKRDWVRGCEPTEEVLEGEDNYTERVDNI